MKYRRRSIKKRIHWLQDQSAWQQTTYSSALAPNAIGADTRIPLIADENASSGASAFNLAQAGRFTNFGDMIVDAISGKFSFGVNGIPPGAVTVAAGMWGLFLRFGIIAMPKATEEGSVANELTEGSNKLWSLNPGDTASQVLAGSLHAPGVSWWWRRDFAFPTMQFADGTPLQPIQSEWLCPPGPYIYIKPRKRLPVGYSLWLVGQMSTLDLSGATGHVQLGMTSSLRVAAHRDHRRD